MNIQVPEGMLKAAIAAVQDAEFDRYRVFLEAALRWLAENPIVPTKEQCEEIHASAHPTLTTPTLICRAIAEWQRCIFLAPSPEVPEAIADLMLNENPSSIGVAMPSQVAPTSGLTESFTYTTGDFERKHNAAVLEAYRRGLKAGAK